MPEYQYKPESETLKGQYTIQQTVTLPDEKWSPINNSGAIVTNTRTYTLTFQDPCETTTMISQPSIFASDVLTAVERIATTVKLGTDGMVVDADYINNDKGDFATLDFAHHMSQVDVDYGSGINVA